MHGRANAGNLRLGIKLCRTVPTPRRLRPRKHSWCIWRMGSEMWAREERLSPLRVKCRSLSMSVPTARQSSIRSIPLSLALSYVDLPTTTACLGSVRTFGSSD